MSINVSDCLKLPCLKEAKIVSGHKGLSKIVTSLSVLEYAETKILTNNQTFRPNEIILSAFASIRDDIKAQCRTLELLHESGNVALILYYVGYIVDELDERLLEKSNELEFPIIVMPVGRIDLAYAEVISEIMEAIFNDRYHETRFINSMLERISQLNTRQRTINNIMQMVSEHLKCTLLLTDAFNKSINFVKRPMSGWLSEEMLLELFTGKSPDNDIDFAELIGNAQATAYRIPFVHDAFKHLFLIAVDETGLIKRDDLISMVELLEVSSNIWNSNFEDNYMDGLIPAILNGNYERARQIAETFHININEINSLFIVQIEDVDLSLYEKHLINEHLNSDAGQKLKEHGNPYISSIYGELFIAVMGFDGDSSDDKEFLTILQNALAPLNKSLVFTFFHGISLKEMQHAYSMYTDCYDSVRIIYPLHTYYSIHHFEFANECLYTIENQAAKTKDHLLPLKDQRDEEELLTTLAVYYLDGDSDTKKTAEIMTLHRNTVQFRLNKIRQRLCIDIKSMPEQYILYKACALKRLSSMY